jgi:hypothetical protein
MRARRWAVAAVLAAAAVSGCGGAHAGTGAGEPEGVDATTPVDATDGTASPAAPEGEGGGGCDLVTEDEVEQALGGVDLVLQEGSGGMECVFELADAEANDIKLAQVFYVPETFGDAVTLEAIASAGAGLEEPLTGSEDGVERIDDLGDGAFFLTALVPILYVADGNNMINVSVLGTRDDRDASITLARLALARH